LVENLIYQGPFPWSPTLPTQLEAELLQLEQKRIADWLREFAATDNATYGGLKDAEKKNAENVIYRGLFDDIKDINIAPDLTLSFTLWVIENSEKTELRKPQFGKDVPTAEQVVQFLAHAVNSFPDGCYKGDIDNECNYPTPDDMDALAEITIKNLNIKKTKPSTKKAGTTALPKKPRTIKPTKKPVTTKPVKKSVVAKSPKKTIAAKTKTDKPKINKPGSADCIEATLANGFTPSQVKKYQGRPSPPYPAANCAGEEMYGQGKGSNTLYKSVPRGKSYVWAKV